MGEAGKAALPCDGPAPRDDAQGGEGAALRTSTDEETGVVYLDPITYEQGIGGWVVPEGERDRWEHPVKGKPFSTAASYQRDLPDLIRELDHWLFLSPRLKGQLRGLYEREPVRATRIVEHVVRSAQSGTLRSPDGLLASLLQQVQQDDIEQLPEPPYS